MAQKKTEPPKVNEPPTTWWPRPEVGQLIYGLNPIDWERVATGKKPLEPGPDQHSMLIYARTNKDDAPDQWYVCVFVGTTVKDGERGKLPRHFFTLDEVPALKDAELSRTTKFNFKQPWSWIPYNNQFFPKPPWWIHGARTPCQGFLNLGIASVKKRFLQVKHDCGYDQGWPI